MTHQVHYHYSSLSERLSHILDNIGYSREDRNRKVTAAIETEVFLNIKIAIEGTGRTYVFGSRGEGSTGPGLESDTDHLHQISMMKIVTDISQCHSEMVNFLMVNDKDTHPGYVKLQYTNISPGYIPVPQYLEGYTDLIFTTDSRNRIVLSNTMHHYFGNVSGPAIHNHHDLKELSTDDVTAFRCSQWPQEGYKWFQRRRLHGWPTPIQIENAREYGCFATPVGHPHSSECLVEWRLSFSIAERELTRSFEDTTMKVYILLKMIRKRYIEPVVGDALSSYHCKVCMFWMRERTPHGLWCNENLLQCLVLCIRQLYEWATTGFCPDYFIATNNIYDRKIIGAVRHNVVQILENLLSSNCSFILEINCCNLGQHMAYEISRFDDCIVPIVLEELVNHKSIRRAATICRYGILKNIPQHYSSLVNYLDRIMYACTYLPFVMQYPLKHAMLILWSQLGFCIVTHCKDNAHILSREQVDYFLALASGCLSFGIKSDATSVRLKLCGLGMELGNHNLIETSLQHISDYHMNYIFSDTLNACVILKCNTKLYSEMLYRNQYNIEKLMQTKMSFSVVYLPLEMTITPKPLRMEMFRSVGAPSELGGKCPNSWFDWSVVDSLICLYFFQYLNFSRQRKDRQKQVTIDNMIHVIRTEPKIPHRDTAFNLLGYSFMQENKLTNAFRCFKHSLNIRPYHNAAKLYLGVIFNRIHATDRGHTL